MPASDVYTCDSTLVVFVQRLSRGYSLLLPSFRVCDMGDDCIQQYEVPRFMYRWYSSFDVLL